ncbi:MAG: hypothetical protein Ct9H300mP22_2880 [Gammaproteobacteria bacterium]|nr:MAG: hypothetical protein Ct9H300mP22_2880 [Gammaproteobacteria bacterium]
MPTSIFGPYTRTIFTGAVIRGYCYSHLPSSVGVWIEVQPFFEWMETTWFGVIGKTWGAAFAFIKGPPSDRPRSTGGKCNSGRRARPWSYSRRCTPSHNY